MAGEREAAEAIRQVHRRVGFSPAPVTKVTLPAGWRQVLEDSFAQGTRDLVAKLRTAARPSGSVGERMPVHRPGVEGGDLKKGGNGGAHEQRLAREHREARAAGERAGDALVAAAKAARAVPVPTGAVADARAERDRLVEVAKATGNVSDGRLKEAAQLAEALATPPTRAPYVMPDPPTAAPWTPHGGDVAASEGAAALMGCTAEELASAHRDAAQGAPGHLDRLTERSVTAAIKAAPRIAIGTAPPRLKRA